MSKEHDSPDSDTYESGESEPSTIRRSVFVLRREQRYKLAIVMMHEFAVVAQ